MTELPLSQRVSAPDTLALPSDDEYTWRPATVDDVEAIYLAEREIGAEDHPHYVAPREEFAEDFEKSYIDPARDTVVVFDRDGRLVAWGMVIMPPGQETLVRSILAGGVVPSSRGRGIGQRLLGWQIARGEQQLASSDRTLPGWIVGFVQDRAEATQRLYARAGLGIARYFIELRRDLSEDIVELPIDPAVRVTPFEPALEEATRLARNNAFRDHWGSQPTLKEDWHAFTTREISRPDLSTVAVGERDGVEEVAGFILVSANEEDWENDGFTSAYIDLVGVPREWRKRGLAPALLTKSLQAMKAAGLEKAILDVDAENPTGALGLYTNLGFTENSRSMSFNRVY